MEKINNTKKKNNAILKAKELVKIAKEKKLIKPLEEAFKQNPVSEEAHKGKLAYFK